MIVILAEKPSVAASIAASLKDVTLSNGEVLETKHLSIPKYDRLIKEARKDGYFKGKKHFITYAFGHLFTLKEPEELDPSLKSWKMDTLPFHFEDIPLKMIGGATYANNKKQFDVIKKLFTDTKVKKIMVATDAGREGELIFRTIYEQTRSKKPFDRMWLKDQTEQGILDAYHNAKPGKAYDGLADAARCRQESDWLVGMNLTRAMTLKFGGFRNVLSIGRVQTPTLAILVNREQEIQHFIPEDYWTLKAEFSDNGNSYEGTWFNQKVDRFTKQQDGEAILKKVKTKNGVITDLVVKEVREGNPLLYDLNELQRVMNRVAGFSASKTLQIAQALYDEHKLITYPRTSSRYIASGTGKTVQSRLKAIESAFGNIVTPALGKPMARYMIDDSKTSDHEAIIPTTKKPNIARLSSDQKLVYDIIVKRFVAAFYPACIWEDTQVVTTVEGETFKSSGKAIKVIGWREVEGLPNTTTLPRLKKQAAVQGKKYSLEAKKTQPPKRLTEGDLLAAMENAGRFVEEDELKAMLKENGIGTPATRANIIEELIRRGYIRRDKKNLVPIAEKGIALMDVLPVDILKSPELTASWEKKLADIEAGKISRKAFMQEIKAAVEEMVAQVNGSQKQALSNVTSIPSTTKTGRSKSRSGSANGTAKEVIATCSCGGSIYENTKGYSCSNWKNGCKNTIWKNAMEKLGKKKISKTEAKQLFTKGVTTRKVKLKSSKGEFQAKLAFKNNKIELEF